MGTKTCTIKIILLHFDKSTQYYSLLFTNVSSYNYNVPTVSNSITRRLVCLWYIIGVLGFTRRTYMDSCRRIENRWPVRNRPGRYQWVCTTRATASTTHVPSVCRTLRPGRYSGTPFRVVIYMIDAGVIIWPNVWVY